MATPSTAPVSFEQFLAWFDEVVERNDKAHGDLIADIHAAEDRLIRWLIGTGIAVVVALAALDLLG